MTTPEQTRWPLGLTGTESAEEMGNIVIRELCRSIPCKNGCCGGCPLDSPAEIRYILTAIEQRGREAGRREAWEKAAIQYGDDV